MLRTRDCIINIYFAKLKLIIVNNYVSGSRKTDFFFANFVSQKRSKLVLEFSIGSNKTTILPVMPGALDSELSFQPYIQSLSKSFHLYLHNIYEIHP